ncbi:MAG: hypothetical protein HY393_01420 [Candidatus Diapherotrites archaeon]|nr:hypothetical protein [Candidatus Diapherotrites archaeon]
MNAYRVFKNVQFDEKFVRLTVFEKARVERFLNQLTEKPGMVGKPLGVHFFREKKFNGKRVYYLVYEEWKSVMIINISNKKEQASTIQEIRMKLGHYKDFMQSILKKLNLI